MKKSIRNFFATMLVLAFAVIAGVVIAAPSQAKAEDWKDSAQKLHFGGVETDYTDGASKDLTSSHYYKFKAAGPIKVTINVAMTGDYATPINGVERYKIIVRNNNGVVVKTSKELSYDKDSKCTVWSWTNEYKAGTYYIEVVEVITAAGNGLAVNFEAEMITYPKTLKASQSNGQVTLKWPKVKTATGYSIFRATRPDGKFTRVKSIGGSNSTSYTTKQLKSGKTFYYKVRAYLHTPSKTYNSAFSDVVTVTIK